MTWTDLKKKMTDKYCPRSEIKKPKIELWNLNVKGIDVLGYNRRFQELALLCVRMFSKESDKIEKYVGGLPDMIHGSVMASRPKTMQDAIEMAMISTDKIKITRKRSKIWGKQERGTERGEIDNLRIKEQEGMVKNVTSRHPIGQEKQGMTRG
ncbi:reverse transcriptase domain-containing protein [Tanacetum coccineum]|uniref:Reverse transcriptase domain-containing protein n=1 Tax=Tanacetum coccineum TaxID=301880 RepID=A0ABQ5FFR9_9ASTR